MSDRPATVFVRFAVEGFHCWPGAPPRRAYLASAHRHQFHVEVRLEVDHDDREVEFHDVLGQAREFFPGGDMGTQSCEAMARELAKKMARYYERAVEVSVSEDGEVGAVVAALAPPT